MIFSWLDIILFLGLGQGFFLAIALNKIDNRNNKANNALSITICMACIMLFGRIVSFRLEAQWVSMVSSFVDVTILLFAPLLYCYIRRLLFQESPVFKLSLWHYIPAFFHTSITLTTILLPNKIQLYLIESKAIAYFWFVAEIAGIISFIMYISWAFVLLKKHRMLMKDQISYTLVVRKYVRYLLCTICLFICMWLLSLLSNIGGMTGLSYFLNYSIVWTTIPVFIYLIGYYSLRQPELFRLPLVPKSKMNKARLEDDEVSELKKRLDLLMHEEKLYKQSDLSLKGLAEKLDTSSNNLSWLLNQVYQQSFYDYINLLRVNHIQKEIDKGLHLKHTLLAIALDAGFNSKSTFNKAFKTISSKTPSEYIKYKKEV